MKTRSAWFVVLTGLIFQLGCYQARVVAPAEDLDDVLPKRVKHTSDLRMIQQMTELRQKGMTVITMGQDYLISIPASLIFANESPRLTWSSYEALNSVIAFLGQFRKIAVTITAYGSPCTRSLRRDMALTKARAQQVANYFWAQGLDTRLLFMKGAGPTQPIVLNGTGDQSNNARIEITFRDAVA